MYTADQGAQWPFAKWNLYDAGIRTPVLAYWPGRIAPGSKTRALVSLIDLLPTMIAAAGGDPPREIDGRSFLPVLLGRSGEHREEVFASHTGDKEFNRAPMRCVRAERYKYILNLAPEIPYATHISKSDDRDNYWTSWLRLAETNAHAADVTRRYEHRPAEELYDVAADPYELKNLAADPAHTGTLAKLREALKKWRVQQGEDLSKVPMPEDARSGPLKYAG
jgi:uncharacterized sulfatase